ncbi:glycosyltransferase [Effusibacillus dendaii]|uniref:glycosyltransferase n=1 Tax=Effusibacillus dendaii TaxID=2743772 RepID=UPI00190CB406
MNIGFHHRGSDVNENIVFFGSRWDVPALLRLSNIVVLASLQDMHPYTLMEAQVAGKACVTSVAGGIPEVVQHGETGLIFKTGNSVQR